MLKCENYLTVITNRSRYLIHFHSTRRLPNWEVLFRIAILDPAKREKILLSHVCMFNMCVRQTFNEARELDKKRALDGSESEMEKLKFKIHFFSPFTPRFI